MLVQAKLQLVHGGIRHLESNSISPAFAVCVHGGIRHLEIHNHYDRKYLLVHGGIRHLEMIYIRSDSCIIVHGGIRHLESDPWQAAASTRCSWRHTPFRNVTVMIGICSVCSWRNLF